MGLLGPLLLFLSVRTQGILKAEMNGSHSLAGLLDLLTVAHETNLTDRDQFHLDYLLLLEVSLWC